MSVSVTLAYTIDKLSFNGKELASLSKIKNLKIVAPSTDLLVQLNNFPNLNSVSFTVGNVVDGNSLSPHMTEIRIVGREFHNVNKIMEMKNLQTAILMYPLMQTPLETPFGILLTELASGTKEIAAYVGFMNAEGFIRHVRITGDNHKQLADIKNYNKMIRLIRF